MTFEPCPPTLTTRLISLGRDIKLSHSVFALPFALLAMFLAAADDRRLPTLTEFALIVLCMVLARTTAMAFNRWADAGIDAANPRTRGRAIPSGRLSRPFVAAVTGLAAALFVLTTGGFWLWRGNPWPLFLSPLALAWLCGYSYAKRFTSLSHLWLGSALALSPVAAALAIRPASVSSTPSPPPILLAAMVVTWVAAFDIIYALQDVAVDRAAGLYSMPARLGIGPALWISRGLHTLSIAALAALLALSPVLSWPFGIGVILTAGLLVLEHILVHRSHTHHIHVAFFTLNGVISLMLGGLGILDVVRHLHVHPQ